MSKPCRMTRAHQHHTLPGDTTYTYVLTVLIAPPDTRLLRVRWIDATREWQACYTPQVPA